MRFGTVAGAFGLAVVLVMAAWLTLRGQTVPEGDFVYVSGVAHKTLDPQQMSWVDGDSRGRVPLRTTGATATA